MPRDRGVLCGANTACSMPIRLTLVITDTPPLARRARRWRQAIILSRSPRIAATKLHKGGHWRNLPGSGCLPGWLEAAAGSQSVRLQGSEQPEQQFRSSARSEHLRRSRDIPLSFLLDLTRVKSGSDCLPMPSAFASGFWHSGEGSRAGSCKSCCVATTTITSVRL